MKFKTKVLILNKPTTNGRIYTTELFKNILKDTVVKEQLKTKSLFGPFLANNEDWTGVIDISKAAFIVNKLYIRGNFLWMQAETLDTPNGISAANSLASGKAAIAFSPAGFGRVNSNTKKVEDYSFNTVQCYSVSGK